MSILRATTEDKEAKRDYQLRVFVQCEEKLLFFNLLR